VLEDKRYLKRLVLNVESDFACVKSVGSEFQKDAPENARLDL